MKLAALLKPNRHGPPGFASQAVFGVVASLVAAIAIAASHYFVPLPDAVGLGLALTTFVYLAWIVFKSKSTSGRLTTLVLFVCGSLICALFAVSIFELSLYLMVSIWLTRLIFWHRSLITGVMDACLLIAGFLAALWALQTSSSWFLTLWCFYLVQALGAFLPKLPQIKNRDTCSGSFEDNPTQSFHRAYKEATEAAQRLSSAHVSNTHVSNTQISSAQVSKAQT